MYTIIYLITHPTTDPIASEVITRTSKEADTTYKRFIAEAFKDAQEFHGTFRVFYLSGNTVKQSFTISKNTY